MCYESRGRVRKEGMCVEMRAVKEGNRGLMIKKSETESGGGRGRGRELGQTCLWMLFMLTVAN